MATAIIDGADAFIHPCFSRGPSAFELACGDGEIPRKRARAESEEEEICDEMTENLRPRKIARLGRGGEYGAVPRPVSAENFMPAKKVPARSDHAILVFAASSPADAQIVKIPISSLAPADLNFLSGRMAKYTNPHMTDPDADPNRVFFRIDCAARKARERPFAEWNRPMKFSLSDGDENSEGEEIAEGAHGTIYLMDSLRQAVVVPTFVLEPGETCSFVGMYFATK